MRKYALYIVGILVVVLVYVIVILLAPREINWQPTFQNKHKIPFGTRALYEMLCKMPQYQPVATVHEPIYNHLEENTVEHKYNEYDSLARRDYSDPTDTTDRYIHVIPKVLLPDSLRYNYIFINSTFDIGSTDLISLLDAVYKGDNVFIAAYSFSKDFADSLHVHTKLHIYQRQPAYILPDEKYTLSRAMLSPYYTFLDSIDTATTKLIGYVDTDYPNFVKIKHGAGTIYLNTSPEMFTNYYVLNDTTYSYAFYCLNELKGKKTWWDEYYKEGREESDSSLRYILSQPPLRLSLYIVLFAMLMYVLFESKRRQKAIPVIKAMRNDSLEFIKSLSGLYFKTSEHKIMAEKKWKYLAEHIRTRYNIICDIQDTDLPEKISRKTLYPIEKTGELVVMAQHVFASPSISAQALIQFNQNVNQFYNYIK